MLYKSFLVTTCDVQNIIMCSVVKDPFVSESLENRKALSLDTTQIQLHMQYVQKVNYNMLVSSIYDYYHVSVIKL